jgi:hypothetical protein
LSEDGALATVTIGEYLDRFPVRERLHSLFSGSWINQNLETWIGESDQNRAWEYLARTRSRLIAWQNESPLADVETLAKAWEQLYIAEGSDWFWWYYSRNRTDQSHQFDVEYRNHLANIYAIMGQPVPKWLREPIATAGERARQRPVSGRVAPRLDTQLEASPEWTGAGYVEPDASTGAMQMGATALRRLYFGYNPGALFLRLETNEDVSRYRVSFYLSTPRQERANVLVRHAARGQDTPGVPLGWEVSVNPGSREASLNQAMGGDMWQPRARLEEVAAGTRSVEVEIPLSELGLQIGDTVNLLATVSRDEVLVESLPRAGHVGFPLN